MQLKKSTRRLLRDKPSGLNEEANMGDGNDGQAIKSIENTSTVEKIGDLTPIQDFEVMLSRRDSPEWVGKAIKEMKNKIFDLVEDSYEGDNYGKALEYLVALRKGCVLEQVYLHLSLSLLSWPCLLFLLFLSGSVWHSLA